MLFPVPNNTDYNQPRSIGFSDVTNFLSNAYAAFGKAGQVIQVAIGVFNFILALRPYAEQFIEMVEPLGLKGAEKKAQVMEWMKNAFDMVAQIDDKLQNAPALWDKFEKQIAAMIDSIVALKNATGDWLTPNRATAAKTPPTVQSSNTEINPQ
jgi:hypothetical protein